MGWGNAFLSLGRIIGPIWAGLALDWNLSLPYLSGSAILLGGFATSMLWLTPRAPRPPARG